MATEVPRRRHDTGEPLGMSDEIRRRSGELSGGENVIDDAQYYVHYSSDPYDDPYHVDSEVVLHMEGEFLINPQPF